MQLGASFERTPCETAAICLAVLAFAIAFRFNSVAMRRSKRHYELDCGEQVMIRGPPRNAHVVHRAG